MLGQSNELAQLPNWPTFELAAEESDDQAEILAVFRK
jgi:hypothetical protein